MKIQLSFVGYLKIEGVKNGDEVEVADGATAADIMTQFGIPQHHQRHITIFVNDEERRSNEPLQEGDQLALIIQIGGG